MPAPNAGKLLSASELADHFQMYEAGLVRMMEEGDIPSVEIGGTRYATAASVKEWREGIFEEWRCDFRHPPASWAGE